MSNISFEGFHWYNDNLSGNFLCAKVFWGKFPSCPQTVDWLGKLPLKEQQLLRTQHFILSWHAHMFVLQLQDGPCGILLTPMIQRQNYLLSTKQRFGFSDSSFSLLQWHLPLWHLACAQNWKTKLRSHNLKISGKKTSKSKSEGNFSHIKNSCWPVKSWLDKSNILRKIEWFPTLKGNVNVFRELYMN